jgi:F0F1-type ATP synthase membrane subunit b/b'
MRLDRFRPAAPASSRRALLRRTRTSARVYVLLAGIVVGAMTLSRTVHLQEPAAPAAHGQPTNAEAKEAKHGGGVLSAVAKIFNFALLAGGLVYFLRSPVAAYLASRSTEIRQDLVSAQQLRATATAQLEDIRRQLESLPGELEALKKQGAEDLRAERARIRAAAAAERERLLLQTRREIEMRFRIARRELMEHAAQLAVNVAQTRIVRSITPADQLRLVDRYASQLGEAP